MEQKIQQPKNIFEVINLNIYNLSENVNDLYKLVAEIHNSLFPKAAPTEGGAPKEESPLQ
jgi:tetrahydromethanopterin S-methyltransferase subunit B